MNDVKIDFLKNSLVITPDVKYKENIFSRFFVSEREKITELDFASERIAKFKEQKEGKYHTVHCVTEAETDGIYRVLSALNLLFFKYCGNTSFTYGIYLPGSDRVLELYYMDVPDMEVNGDLPEYGEKGVSIWKSNNNVKIQPSVAVLFLEEDVAVSYENEGADLLFVFFTEKSQMACKLIYSDIYQEDIMKQLIKDFQEAVRFGGKSKDRSVKQFVTDKLSVGIGEFYDLDEQMTIVKRMELMAEKNPEQIIYEDERKQFTYRTLLEKVNQICRYFDDYYEESERIGLAGKRSAEMLVIILGIIKSGRTYVPLDREMKTERLKKVIADAKIDFIVCGEENWNPDIVVEQITVQRLIEDSKEYDVIYDSKNASIYDEMCILYTSGTTGEPKASIHFQTNVLNGIYSYLQLCPLGKEDVLAQRSPFQHIPSTVEIFAGPVLGIRTVVIPDEVVIEPETFHEYIRKKKITWIQMVPTLVKLCFVNYKRVPVTIKYLITLGEEFSRDDLEVVQQKYPGISILNNYGMTEMNLVILGCFNKKEKFENKLPLGKPVANTEVVILNDAGEIAPEGMIGQMAVNSRFWRKKDVEKYETLYLSGQNKNYVLTGDYANFKTDGTIEYRGRKDSLCKIKGKRVDLFYVQNVLEANDKVKECVVMKESEQNRDMIVAYLSVTEGLDVIDIRKYLARELDSYMVPEKIVFLDKLPKTKTGKISRSELDSGSSQMEKKKEKKLYRIFEDIIGGNVENELNTTFRELGISSMQIIEIMRQIEEKLEIEIKVSDLFSHPTIYQLEQFVNKKMQKDNKFEQEEKKVIEKNEVAVIGMSGIFPGNRDMEEFWKALLAGEDMVIEMPEERKSKLDITGEEKIISGGYLKDIGQFEPLYFGISPKEASFMEPQQKAALMSVRNLIEEAGYTKEVLWDKDISVFVGAAESHYISEKDTSYHEYSKMGTDTAMLPARISYFFDWHGECAAINTACSSSLEAVHHAYRSIIQSDCEMAVAGGVNIISSRRFFQETGALGMFSKKNDCCPFDAQADGIVPGEAAGFILLKPLEQAVADNDNIYAVIKGTYSNQDGKSNGITAPNGLSQEKLARNNLKRSGVNIKDVVHIEAHGTGTKLGDPIEVNALTNVYKMLGSGDVCSLGSVKANIGHAVAASGIVSMIKSCLCLYHHTLVPQIKVNEVNHFLDIEKSPFYFLKEIKDISDRVTAVISINSFGYSGTNTNVLLARWQGVNGTEKHEKTEEDAIEKKSLYEKNVTELVLIQEIEDFSEEHLIHGKEVIPAAVLLKTIKERYEKRYQRICQEMEQIYFLRPLLVEENREFQIDFIPERNRVTFLLSNEEGITCVKGSIKKENDEERVCEFNIKGKIEKSGQKELYDFYSDHHIQYGPHFQLCRHWKKYNDGKRTYADICLEPSWDECYSLDAAMHTAGYIFREDEQSESGIPYSCRNIVWKRPLIVKEEILVKAEKTRDGINIFLCDKEGELLAAIKGLVLLKMDTGIKCQRKVWKETPLEKREEEEKKKQFDYVIMKTSYSCTQKKRYKSMFFEGQKYFLKGSTELQNILYVADTKYKTYFEAYQNVATIIQEVYRARISECGFLVVIPGRNDMSSILNESLISLLGVMNRENQHYSFTLLELPDERRNEWEEVILNELDEGFTNRFIKYNNRMIRHTQQVQDVVLKTAENRRLKPQKTYLLTGGCGGIGRIIAGYLASKYQADIILSGRRNSDEQIENFLEELRRRGGNAKYVQMDVTDYKQCREQLKDEIEQIDGVIHCAGIKNDSFLINKEEKLAEDVLRTKIAGTVNLYKLFEGKKIDFMFLCSSIASEVYQNGQADYAYANMFLSLFAEHVKSNFFITAAEWCYWENGGMQMEERAYRKMIASGQHTVNDEEGCSILEDTINSDIRCIIVY